MQEDRDFSDQWPAPWVVAGCQLERPHSEVGGRGWIGGAQRLRRGKEDIDRLRVSRLSAGGELLCDLRRRHPCGEQRTGRFALKRRAGRRGHRIEHGFANNVVAKRQEIAMVEEYVRADQFVYGLEQRR